MQVVLDYPTPHALTTYVTQQLLGDAATAASEDQPAAAVTGMATLAIPSPVAPVGQAAASAALAVMA